MSPRRSKRLKKEAATQVEAVVTKPQNQSSHEHSQEAGRNSPTGSTQNSERGNHTRGSTKRGRGGNGNSRNNRSRAARAGRVDAPSSPVRCNVRNFQHHRYHADISDLLSQGFELEASFANFLDKLEQIIKNDPHEMDWDLCSTIFYRHGEEHESNGRGSSDTPRGFDEHHTSKQKASALQSEKCVTRPEWPLTTTTTTRSPQSQEPQLSHTCKCTYTGHSGPELDEVPTLHPGLAASVATPATSHSRCSNSMSIESILQHPQEAKMAEALEAIEAAEQSNPVEHYSRFWGLDRNGAGLAM